MVLPQERIFLPFLNRNLEIILLSSTKMEELKSNKNLRKDFRSCTAKTQLSRLVSLGSNMQPPKQKNHLTYQMKPNEIFIFISLRELFSKIKFVN